MEEGEPPNEEEEEPTSEFVGDLELIFGRGKSGFKDIYPHRKGWQAKVTVEDKGVCSLGVFKTSKQAAIKAANFSGERPGSELLPQVPARRARRGEKPSRNRWGGRCLTAWCTVTRQFPRSRGPVAAWKDHARWGSRRSCMSWR